MPLIWKTIKANNEKRRKQNESKTIRHHLAGLRAGILFFMVAANIISASIERAARNDSRGTIANCIRRWRAFEFGLCYLLKETCAPVEKQIGTGPAKGSFGR
jgi:hypothetical protein